MPSVNDENERLLAMYRSQLNDSEKAIQHEVQKRRALTSIVEGLEALTGKRVIQSALHHTIPQNLIRPAAQTVTRVSVPEVKEQSSSKHPAPAPATIVGAAVRAMRKLHRQKEIGASGILRLIIDNDGTAPNYATLFNALKRSASQEDGFIYKKGSKFGLREWLSPKS